MSENQRKPSFIEKLKNTKINRATVITAIVLVAAIAITVAVTVATKRTKDVPTPPVETEDNIPDDTKRPSETPKDTEKPVETQKPAGNGSSAVQNKLPSFSLPVSGVLASKHDPDLQVYSPTLNHYRVHLGIDIATEESAPVYAAADGKIARIWNDDLMGYSIAIAHSGNSYTYYQNLSETLAKGITEGATVHSGQLIATVGDSALTEVADEPHLHFEMTVADLSVDPLAYFSESDLEVLRVDKVTE